ncbi:tRNA (adenosine(37)-N6)-dimethylallyltransferase MiaA [Hyphomicrobium sp. CS1GBMeth3]|uniref:tRNA (adenosine(37)-N6)-dimethylallyltransferase MiaA n=1 Tax=Hyphomicrobium sp. CS1GBMeth3 TaxID=1892845 RepID=UPI00092FF056|nr:tRNA (adenosine(37)-N6)-dimethylallyltransferase MiaA [Hyphomicrobium sp. CS1GBMeth3]
MTYPAPILIAGPTASGKSALALSLAERLGGIVINADAMQVYRELRVLTARPSEDDERRAPHRLYGHVPGREAYSAARYATEARATIAEAEAAGRIPIVVGGTGLYFKALVEGLSPVPSIPESIRAHWRARASEEGAAALHEMLKARDPEMAARLLPTDPQRIVRALEVLDATGISLARWQEQPGEPVVAVREGHAIVVSPERDELRRRCDARFDAMMDAGALDEVRALLDQKLSPELPVMRALGVKPLAELLVGRLDLEAAAEAAKAETRQYAKRQLTWLRRNMITWKWIDTQETESFAASLVDFIKSKA